MDRKLSSIEAAVQDRADDFQHYLDEHLPSGVQEFVETLQSRTRVYLFSGVIRDFFLRDTRGLRDVDFIIEDDVNISELFPALDVFTNSFGGCKTWIDTVAVDLWRLDSTWGLNRGQLKLPFEQPKLPLEELQKLPTTTFFNFSSIVFSLSERKFIVGKPFLRFLRDKTIDVVLEENPLPSLCIVNSIYYSEKYNLRLSSKLKKFITSNYRTCVESFDEVQIRHFNKILYSKRALTKKIGGLE